MMKKSELPGAAEILRETLPEGGSILCAVSGGLDSMCLLHWLSAQQSMTVTAAHFNHHLRGADADADEAFVQNWCREREIPFLSGGGDVAGYAAEHGLSLEEAARKLRYAFLRKEARRLGCWITTAHHADDQAETVLLNLVRGTGTAGLGAMRPAGGGLLRPFLNLRREELETYAKIHGIPHVEDATNALDDASRNLLRHQVLPVLQQLNPRAVEHICRAAELAAADSDVIEALAQDAIRWATEEKQRISIRTTVLTDLEPAVCGRAILLLLERAAGQRQDFTARHVAAVEQRLRAGRGKTDLPYGLHASVTDGQLRISPVPKPPEEIVIAPGETVTFGSWRVSLGADEAGMCLHLPEGEPVRVTLWRSDDRMTLPGSRGSRSLKRLCAERGISPVERDSLPVLRIGEKAAAVPGVGIDLEFTPRSERETVSVYFDRERESL